MRTSVTKDEDYYGKISPYINRYYEYIESKVYSDTTRDIQHNLNILGISFEGRELPISIQPTLLTKKEIHRVSVAGRMIRSLLIDLINQFISVHRSGIRDSFLHKAFAPYSKWWDLIADENRTLPAIQLMRYDAVREPDGAYRFMETNTACPGGVIHCSLVKQAWSMTRFGFNTLKNIKTIDYPIDNPASFIKFLVECAQKVSFEKEINIAICNFQNTYTNELTTLQKKHEELVCAGEIPSGKLLIADIMDIQTSNDQAYLNGVPLSLIYNKIDPLMIDPHNTKISGWIEASQCSKTDFLNSFGALFLTEAKRILGLLSTPKYREELDFHQYTLNIIDEYIPYTRLLSEVENSDAINFDLYNLVLNQKNQFVLKADALTRGKGVYIGSQCSKEEWEKAINDIFLQDGVIQLCCKTPYRESFIADTNGSLLPFDEYYGIDLFYFGDKFAGPVSRSHQNMIFNIGSGGKESPVITMV